MKMFALDNFSELLEVRFPQHETIYSCDSSTINNKYLAAGKTGQLYYLAPVKHGD